MRYNITMLHGFIVTRANQEHLSTYYLFVRCRVNEQEKDD